MITTYNFLMEKDPSTIIKPDLDGEFIDERNGIKCIGTTADLQCYINYIRLLNGMRDKWKGFGYLDLGMIPAAMGPSFLHKAISEYMSQMLGAKKVKAYAMPSVSFMSDTKNLTTKDIWVFREDASKAMGKSIVSTEEFIRWCWE